jgi:cell wall-associated NlpC family hydrolase
VRLVVTVSISAGVGAAEAQNPRAWAASAPVLLQPFSLDRSSPVHLAYYAPPAVTRAEAVEPEIEPEQAEPMAPRMSGPIVRGRRAILRNGTAYAPANAPDNVRCAIWATNALRHKPYVWGGGHGSFDDYGYDCSGAVSYALHSAGLLDVPLPSSDFLRYGRHGRGKWITIYTRPGHTFAVIAGLRLDTTDLRYGTDVGPRWYEDFRDTHGFDARHPDGF